MSKHHPTAAPREMETQTLNRVSTEFSLDFRRRANLLICAFQFFSFFFVIQLFLWLTLRNIEKGWPSVF